MTKTQPHAGAAHYWQLVTLANHEEEEIARHRREIAACRRRWNSYQKQAVALEKAIGLEALGVKEEAP